MLVNVWTGSSERWTKISLQGLVLREKSWYKKLGRPPELLAMISRYLSISLSIYLSIYLSYKVLFFFPHNLYFYHLSTYIPTYQYIVLSQNNFIFLLLSKMKIDNSPQTPPISFQPDYVNLWYGRFICQNLYFNRFRNMAAKFGLKN